jgi:hypothetical protein
MPELYTLHRPIEGLEAPVLVVHFEGWIDAGNGGIGAMNALLNTLDVAPLATFDIDALLDLRARRPLARIVDGVNAALNWPRIQLAAGHDRDAKDVLLLSGPEPDFRWHDFAAAVRRLGAEAGVRLVVGLNAFASAVPHTRPSPVLAAATSEELARKVGFLPGDQQVPVGIEAVLQTGFAELGVPAIGLWTPVPYYAAAMLYPGASLALLESLSTLAELDLDLSVLREATDAVRARIDALVEANPQFADLLQRLEAEAGPLGGAPGFGDLPSGDELAAEFERFLREQGE